MSGNCCRSALADRPTQLTLQPHELQEPIELGIGAYRVEEGVGLCKDKVGGAVFVGLGKPFHRQRSLPKPNANESDAVCGHEAGLALACEFLQELSRNILFAERGVTVSQQAIQVGVVPRKLFYLVELPDRAVKVMLRGEGPNIPELSLDGLKKELKRQFTIQPLFICKKLNFFQT